MSSTSRPAPSTTRTGSVLIALAAIAAVLVPLNANARQLWGEVGLPGGAVAARYVAGLGPSEGRADTAWLLDVIRSDNGGENLERRVELLSRYLNDVDLLQTEFGGSPDGILLPKQPVTGAEEKRFQRLFEALGLRLRWRDNQYVAEIDDSAQAAERREWLDLCGVNVETLIADANFGLPMKISIGESVLPLPLPRVWSGAVFKNGTLPVLSILQNASARSMYVGLMALDLETLGFLSERPEFVSRLAGTLGVLAAFGRSIHVHGGAVEVPGGKDLAPLWESLVGSSPREPERFIQDLLARDEGRLAYFYDAVTHLTASRQAFALGAHLPMNRRVAFVRRVYSVFQEVDPGWKIANRPSRRPDFDPVMPLMWVDMLPDGTVGPSWWPALLSRVFASGDWPAPTRPSPALTGTREADAAWLLEWLFENPKQARGRFEALRYLQRNFQRVAVGSAPSIEIAIRTRLDMPALAIALERMDVRDPVLLSDVARAARELTYAGSVEDAGRLVARWQMCLGLVEQIHLKARLSSERLRGLLESLSEPLPKSRALAGVWFATWFFDRLLPAVLDGAVGPDLERQMLRAFAGAGTAPARRVSWEGLDYSVDRSTAAFLSAWRIRQRQPGPRLQHLMQLLGLFRHLQGVVRTLEEVKSLADAMTALAPSVRLLPKNAEAIDPAVRPLTDAAKALGRITKPADSLRASGQALTLARALDAVEDAILPSILYALAASPTAAADVFSAASSGHDMTGMFAPADTRPWQVKAWQVPAGQLQQRGGTSLMGAFLLLDVALADATLVRLPSADVPRPQVLDDRDPAALAGQIAIWNTTAALESSPVSPGLRAGRQRIADWITGASTASEIEPILRQAGVDEWRTNLVLSALDEHRARAFDVLTVTEIFQLGSGGAVPAAWSGPSIAIDGCVCRVSPEIRRLEDLRGARHGARTAVLTDVPLRLAEHLDALKLPAWLVPPLLVLATEDWIEHVYQFDLDDWESLTIWPKNISRDRVEEYLLYLISSGVLVPPVASDPGAAR